MSVVIDQSIKRFDKEKHSISLVRKKFKQMKTPKHSIVQDTQIATKKCIARNVQLTKSPQISHGITCGTIADSDFRLHLGTHLLIDAYVSTLYIYIVNPNLSY